MSDSKAVVRDMVDAVNAHNWERVGDLLAADVVRHSCTVGRPVVQGREQLVEFLKEELVAFPDAQEHIHFLFGEGDLVAARMGFRATQTGPIGPYPPTGKEVRADFTCLYRVTDGRVAETWVEWDSLDTLEQLGYWP